MKKELVDKYGYITEEDLLDYYSGISADKICLVHGEQNSKIEFFNCDMDFSDAILILSSVIHEIYAYDKDPGSTMFKLLTKGFDAIAIRDMFVSDEIEDQMVDYELYKQVANTTGMKMIADFAKYYGYPYSKKQFIHYAFCIVFHIDKRIRIIYNS